MNGGAFVKLAGNRKYTGLTVLLLLVTAIALLWTDKSKQMGTGTYDVHRADHIELQLGPDRISIEKHEDHENHNAMTWRIENINGTKVNDQRAKTALVEHVLDLLRSALRPGAQWQNITPEEYDVYGFSTPNLQLALRWNSSPGHSQTEVLHFGNRDFTGKSVFVLDATRQRMAQLSPNVLALIQAQGILAFRERRLFLFDIDDIERIAFDGHCGKNHLERNGDHWEWRGSTAKHHHPEHPTQHMIAQWIERLLSLQYEDEIGTATEAQLSAISKQPLFCEITLSNRRNTQEVVRLFSNASPQSNKNFQASNSRLPVKYVVNGTLMRKRISWPELR
jgi:hypothetical protein